MDKNGFEPIYQTVCAQRVLLDTTAEQTFERDMVLPDYYPDIFRILRCCAEPCVQSQTLSGDRLTVDLELRLTVLYITEGSGAVNCIEQKLPLSRSFELPEEGGTPLVEAVPSCHSLSCRVVNKRRLDIRGMAAVKVRVTDSEDIRVLSGGRGLGVQLRTVPMTFPVKRLSVAKRITVIDELELSDQKPSMGTPLRFGCVLTKGEDRMIAGKLVTKGEAELTVVYSCVSSAGEDTVETMRFTLPFSQIIDMEGIDETFVPQTVMTCAGVSLIPKGEEGRRLECELCLNVICTAVKYAEGDLCTDGYFTACGCDPMVLEEPLGSPVKEEVITAECTASVACPEGVRTILDCFGECEGVTVMAGDQGGCTLTGTAELSVMGVDSEGVPFMAHETAAFEVELRIPEGCLAPEVRAGIVNVSYILSSSDKAEVRAQLRLEARYPGVSRERVLTALVPLTDQPRDQERPYALKLCRRERGETCWDIAKRLGTSVEAIQAANPGLDQDGDHEAMLLIPLV